MRQVLLEPTLSTLVALRVIASLAAHFALAVLLFVAINWVGRHSASYGYTYLSKLTASETSTVFNFVFRVATPLVFLLVISASLYAMKLDWVVKDIHRIILLYILIRVGYNLAMGRFWLLPWKKLALQWGVLVIAANLLYHKLIQERRFLFPDMATVGNEVWLAIVGYLYVLAGRFDGSDVGRERRTKRFILRRVEQFRTSFGDIVDARAKTREMKLLVYGVMVIEDFNRPSLARKFERLLFRIGRARSLGVMQVTTDKLIDDRESVVAGIEKLEECCSEVSADPQTWKISDDYSRRIGKATTQAREEASFVHAALVRYNPSGDYAREIEEVVDIISDNFFQSEERGYLHPELHVYDDLESTVNGVSP